MFGSTIHSVSDIRYTWDSMAGKSSNAMTKS